MLNLWEKSAVEATRFNPLPKEKCLKARLFYDVKMSYRGFFI